MKLWVRVMFMSKQFILVANLLLYEISTCLNISPILLLLIYTIFNSSFLIFFLRFENQLGYIPKQYIKLGSR